MDINTLIEQGKARIAKAKLDAEQERLEQERACDEYLANELAKFKCEALAQFDGIQGLCVTDLPKIEEHTFQASVYLNAPLCEHVMALFNLERPYHSAPRGNCTWKFSQYYVPRVSLEQIGEGVDEPWSVSSDMRDCFRTLALDEALAIASDQYIERLFLEQEALRLNAENKAALAEQAKRDAAQCEMQQAAFYPFEWYRIYYAVVAEEAGERVAVQESFPCLRDTPVDAYFVTAHGKQVRPVTITRIERIVCRDVKEMPGWCPLVETEWGTIKVPPKEAEKVEEA